MTVFLNNPFQKYTRISPISEILSEHLVSPRLVLLPFNVPCDSAALCPATHTSQQGKHCCLRLGSSTSLKCTAEKKQNPLMSMFLSYDYYATKVNNMHFNFCNHHRCTMLGVDCKQIYYPPFFADTGHQFQG